MADKTDNLGFVPDHNELGFVPDDRAPANDLGFVPDAASVPSQYGEAVKYGLQQHLLNKVPQVATAVADKLGLSQDVRDAIQVGAETQQGGLLYAARKFYGATEPTPGYVPTNVGEKLVATGAGLTDPATMAAFELGAQRVAGPVLSKLGLNTVVKAGVENGGNLLTRFARAYTASAIKGAAGGAAAAGAQEGVNQTINDDFKPSQILNRMAEGGVVGAVLNPVLEGAASGLSKGASLVKALKDSGKAEAGITLDAQQTRPEAIQEAWQDAVDKVNAVHKAQGIPEDQISHTLETAFKENLENRGIDVYGGKVGTPSLVRSVEKFSNVDKQVGTQTSEVVQNLITGQYDKARIASDLGQQFAAPIKDLNAQGIDNSTIYHLLRYTEDAPDGSVVFNPEAKNSAGNVRPQYLGGPPTPETLQQLAVLRKSFTSTLLNNPELLGRTGYVEGYVPLVAKNTGEIIQPSTNRGIVDPSFTQSRIDGAFDPLKHEDNIATVASGWVNKVAKFQAFNQHMPQLLTELTKLKYLGQEDAAGNLGNVAMRVMGIKNRADLANTFGDALLKANASTIQELASKFTQPDKFMSEMGQALRNQMYNYMVFTNPRTLIKHVLQPEFVGPAEIGFKNIAAGRKALLNSKSSALADSLLPLMKAKDVASLEEVGAKNFQSKSIGTANKVLSWPAKLGQIAFDKADTVGRKTSFLGAYKQFQNAFEKGGETGTNHVLDGLLFGERALVRKAFNEGGPEAAAQMYGVIRSRRIHYAYGNADLADAFSEGAGKLIPFTTWGSNQLMRVMGDVQSSSYGTLAKRVAYPLAAIAAFRALTGYDIPGAHPLSAASGSLTGEMLPYLKSVGANLSQGKVGPAIDDALSITPIGAAQKKIIDFKKAKGGFAEGVLGLKKAQSVLPQFTKKDLLPRLLRQDMKK